VRFARLHHHRVRHRTAWQHLRPLTEQDARATLDAAWDIGCRHFDTAPLYGLGLAETRLNRFLREHRAEPAFNPQQWG
jgi:aryl-alcohol dehydrogenase-like predicted oxidoreductase